MFATLPESRRQTRRQHRYIILSLFAHTAIAWGVLALTSSASAHVAPPDALPPDITYVAVAPRPEPSVPRVPRPAASGADRGPAIPRIPDLVIGDAVPDVRIAWTPAVMPPSGADADGIHDGQRGDAVDSTLSGPPGARAGMFTAAEVDRPVVLRSGGAPRYPATLRAAGIEGRVIARFVVDTIGRVEPASIEIRETSHARFTEAVHDVLQRARVQPATVAGRRVRQLVDLPFHFSLAR